MLNTPFKLMLFGQEFDLSSSHKNRSECSGLMMMYVIWSVLEICLTCKCFTATLACTKWKSNSICLVLTLKIGFAERKVAVILSHQIIGQLGTWTHNSVRRDYSQIILAMVFATSLYSDFLDNRAIISCFLADHKIKLKPK